MRYIIKAYNISEIQIPYYICPVVWQVLRKEKVKVKFYHIDKNFMPVDNFSKDDFILYPNFFGICSAQNKILSQKYKNLISDNAHAFFAERTGLASFVSPRKFFKNINDGGILYCNKKININFLRDFNRDIKITDFDSFYKNELSIDNQPIKMMSAKTEKELKVIDFESEKLQRLEFFEKIHSKLGKKNKIQINNENVPYVYPYIGENSTEIAKLADKNGIYIIKYGSDLPAEFLESDFSKNLIMIPLAEKMNKLLN